MVLTLAEGRMLSLYCSVGLDLDATGVVESFLFCCLEASYTIIIIGHHVIMLKFSDF